MSSSDKKERWIEHYKSSQMILLVGEGDFSFSACLAKAFRSAHNMVATSLDSLETLMRKYGSFEAHWRELEKRGCLMLHEVDVHDMNKHPTLASMAFDVIIFNFPHSGHTSWLCETDDILIQRHKNLLRGFFRSGHEMLNKGGEIHVAHRDDEPYCKWELEKLAQEAGLVLKEKVAFVKQRYPDYHNKRGSDIQGNKTFPMDQRPFTFKFCVDQRDRIANNDVIIHAVGDDDRQEAKIDPSIVVSGDQSVDDSCEKIGNSVAIGDGSDVNDSCEKIGNSVAIGDGSDVEVKGILALFRGCVRFVLGLMAIYGLCTWIVVIISTFNMKYY